MRGFPDQVKRDIFECQHGICKVLNCYDPIVDFHHCLPNTKVNRKLFPLFLNSPMNGKGLCRRDHEQNSHLFRITEKEAVVYEAYLNKIGGVE